MSLLSGTCEAHAAPPRTAAVPAAAPILLDAHGHFYDCFGGGRFLDHAARNFAHAAAGLGLATHPPPHLVIASTPRSRGLADLHDRARRGDAGRWRLTPTDEPTSLLASRGPGARPELVLIAGAQVATAEGIEVLAIAAAEAIPDGLPLRDTVDAARVAGAVVVLPWGFGKWWLTRGRAVRGLLAALPPGAVFLGDSANRPRPARTPAPLRLAEQSGVRTLPGTDPLPLRAAARGAGRYGCVINAPFDPRRPAASLGRALASPSVRPLNFGVRDSIPSFVRSQLALRLLRTGPTEHAR